MKKRFTLSPALTSESDALTYLKYGSGLPRISEDIFFQVITENQHCQAQFKQFR